MPNGLTAIVDSTQLELILSNISTNISIVKVANMLAIGAGVCVGIVFMWWGVRKITSMLMSAFRKGKMSI